MKSGCKSWKTTRNSARSRTVHAHMCAPSICPTKQKPRNIARVRQMYRPVVSQQQQKSTAQTHRAPSDALINGKFPEAICAVTYSLAFCLLSSCAASDTHTQHISDQMWCVCANIRTQQYYCCLYISLICHSIPFSLYDATFITGATERNASLCERTHMSRNTILHHSLQTSTLVERSKCQQYS